MKGGLIYNSCRKKGREGRPIWFGRNGATFCVAGEDHLETTGQSHYSRFALTDDVSIKGRLSRY